MVRQDFEVGERQGRFARTHTLESDGDGMKRSFLVSLLAGATLVATGLAASAQSNPAVKSAEDRIKKGLSAPDAKTVEEGVKALVNVNTADSFEALTKYVEPASRVGQEYYWLIVKGIAAFTSEEGIGELQKFVVKASKQPIARDVLFWVQSNYSPSLVPMLLDLIGRDTMPDDLKLMAIDHLGTLAQKSCIQPLLDLWAEYDGRRGKEEYVRRIARALGGIAGQEFGENLANWKGWWDRNKDSELAEGPEAGGGGGPGGGTVVDRLDRGRKEEYSSIVENGSRKVLVVCAKDVPLCRHAPACNPPASCPGMDLNYDHIDEILSRMKIPHDVMTKEEIESDKVDLSKYAALLCNCNHFREQCINPQHHAGAAGSLRASVCEGPGAHQPFSCEYTPKAIDKIKKYVERGGFLFTEDWVIEELLEKAWPEFVKHGDYVTEDKVVGVTPEPGTTSHPFIQRLFAAQPKAAEGGGDGGSYVPSFQEIKHEWKIDKDSPKILVTDERKVQVLMQSGELVADPKSTKDRAIAVTFRPAGGAVASGSGSGASGVGRGMVLHVMSHFGKQKSGEDEFALQNLLLNFLLESFRNYQPPRPGQK